MAYEQIFQGLAVEDVLFSKPRLDLSFYNVIRWNFLTSDMLFRLPTQESPKQPSRDCIGVGENKFPMPRAQQGSGGVSSIQPSIYMQQ